jgi:hypothetical protein
MSRSTKKRTTGNRPSLEHLEDRVAEAKAALEIHQDEHAEFCACAGIESGEPYDFCCRAHTEERRLQHAYDDARIELDLAENPILEDGEPDTDPDAPPVTDKWDLARLRTSRKRREARTRRASGRC